VYQIVYGKHFAKELKKLSPQIRSKILHFIDKEFFTTPRPSGAIKLKGSNDFYRIRCGDYRIIYHIHDQVCTLTLVRVAHRSHVYDRLGLMF
jgi:mRNA interferase RelE/StbE